MPAGGPSWSSFSPPPPPALLLFFFFLFAPPAEEEAPRVFAAAAAAAAAPPPFLSPFFFAATTRSSPGAGMRTVPRSNTSPRVVRYETLAPSASAPGSPWQKSRRCLLELRWSLRAAAEADPPPEAGEGASTWTLCFAASAAGTGCEGELG